MRNLPRSVLIVVFVAAPACSSPRTSERAAPLGGVEDLVTPSVELGTLSATAGVSSEGAATYHIPIDVPPGRMGMQPSLGVSYSSSGTNGPLGVGFSLRGFSEIRRCPLDALHPEVVRGDAVDLCFGGRLLLVSGEHMVPGAVYRVLGDPQLRVELDETQPTYARTPMSYFRVSYPDGRVGLFGNTLDARGEGAWKLARLEDRAGNYMLYQYTKSPDGLEHLPARINYTASLVTGPGYASADFGSREVMFEYEDRAIADTYVAYRPMALGGVGLYRRLSAVVTKVDGQVVHRYRFTYSNSTITGRSHLRRIDKCDASDACLPETDFTWSLGGPAPGYEVHELPSIAANTAPDFKDIAVSTSLDVDHDGKIELLFANDSLADHSAARWIVWDPETGIDELPIPARFVEGSGSLAPVAADFNSDGVADLIAPFCSEGHCFDDSVSNIQYGFADSVQVILGRPDDPDGLATPTNSVVLATDLRILIAAIADIDGDSYPDMFMCARDVSGAPEHAVWRFAMNRPDPGTGTGRKLVVSGTQRRCLASELYQVMDSDGDRRDELWVPRGNYARLHPGSYAGIDPTVVDNPQVWDMLTYVGLELPYRDDSGALLSVDAALAVVANGATEPTMWAPSGVLPYELALDFSARILRGCWKPAIEDEQMPDALYQQVLAEHGATVADQLAALYQPPSNPIEEALIGAWLLGGDYNFLPVPDISTNVPANVPFVHTGPSPDLQVDLNGDGLVDLARVVILDPATGDEVEVYDQASGESPPHCRVDETFDYGLGLWINTGAGFTRAGTMKLLAGHEPWRAAQLLARISPIDFNTDGRADFLTPHYGLFESDGYIDQWHILVAGPTGVPDAPLEYKEVYLGGIVQPWYDGSYEWSHMAAEHLSARLRGLGVLFPESLMTDEFPDLVSRATTAIHLSDKRMHDIIFFPGSDAAAAPLALERSGDRPDYLIHASDGLGSVTQWDYAGAHEDDLYELGEATDTAVPVTPRVVVRERREDLGLEQSGFMRYRYHYKEALTDRRGLGALGITRRLVERLTEGEDDPHEVTLTIEGDAAVYDDARKVYPFRGQPTRSVTDTRYHRGDEVRRMVREVVTAWRAVAAPSNNTVTIVDQRVARTFDLGGSACWGLPCTATDLESAVPLETRRYEAVGVDELGNVSHSVDETGDGYRTVTVRQHANFATTTSEPYLVGLVTREVMTSETPQGSATRTTAYDYDAVSGLLRRTTREPDDATGRLWRQTELIRDVRGNISRTIVTASGQQRATVSGWDAQGYFESSTTNSLGHTTTRSHHPGLGLALRTADPNGVVSETCVDGFGRQTCARVRSSLGGPTTGEEMTYVIEPAPGVIGGAAYRISTRRNGIEVVGVAHDRRGRQRQRVWRVVNGSEEEGDAYQQITLYDTLYHVAKRSNPLPLDWAAAEFPGTTFAHDETGRLVAETDASGATRTYYYDGEVTISEDADGRVIHTRRDEQGRQKRRSEGGMVTCFDHGPFGVLAQVRRNCEAGGGLPMRASTMDHDAWNRLVRVDDPELGLRHHGYDGFDQLDVTIDGNGDKIEFDHDSLGRVIHRSSKDGVAVWEYDQGADAIGKLSRTINEAGSIQRLHFFDEFGRPSSHVTNIAKVAYTIELGYSGGRLTHVEYPATPHGMQKTPFRIRYEHDDYGNLRFVYDDVSGAQLWEVKQMDGWGHVTIEDAAVNDFETQRYFDPQTGRPTQFLVQDAGGDAVLAMTYGWTPGGNLDLRSNPTTGTLQTYQYDARGQLERVIQDFVVTQEMVYDVFGNITQKSGVGDYGYDPTSGRLATAGGETFVYDGNGNLYTRNSAKTSAGYRWTAMGKLARVYAYGTLAAFQYDADGVEVIKEIGDRRVTSIDGLYQVIEDGTIEHRYAIRANDRVIAEVTRSVGWGITETLRYLHTDYRGSALATSDGAGQATVADYDAWGVRTQPGGGALPFAAFTEEPVGAGFGGHDADLVAAMIDMGARYYDPRLGRFHSADILVPDPKKGRDWNRYGYARNNPLRYTDPTGHAPEDDSGGDEEPADTKSGEGDAGDDDEGDGVCMTIDGELYCPDDSDWAQAGGAELFGAHETGASGVDGEGRSAADLANAEAASERMARIHHQALAEHERLENMRLKIELMIKDALLAGRKAEIAELQEQLARIEAEKASLGKDFGLDVDPNLAVPLVAVPGASATLKFKPSLDAAGKTSMKLGIELAVPGVKVTPWVKPNIYTNPESTWCAYLMPCMVHAKAVQGTLAVGELSYDAHVYVGRKAINWVSSWFDD